MLKAERSLPMNKVSQLRVLFVLYMLAKTIVEIVIGSKICLDSIDAGGMSWLIRFFGSHLAVPILAVFGNGILLLLGLGLFYFLLQKRNWARIVFLVIGWINVVDALSGILFHSEASRILSHFRFGIDWDQILYLDRVTDILGLVYWGYLIHVLQFNDAVRREFFAPSLETATEQR
jgi:hypothetical protein